MGILHKKHAVLQGKEALAYRGKGGQNTGTAFPALGLRVVLDLPRQGSPEHSPFFMLFKEEVLDKLGQVYATARQDLVERSYDRLAHQQQPSLHERSSLLHPREQEAFTQVYWVLNHALRDATFCGHKTGKKKPYTTLLQRRTFHSRKKGATEKRIRWWIWFFLVFF